MTEKFLSLNKNDNFAFLRGLDLQELLVETESYFLEYRDNLNLPENVTFGVEIEYEEIKTICMDEYIENNFTRWESKVDLSLDSGGEISSPIMTDKQEYWEELQMICNQLTKEKADTLHKAGGHIHIGACVLGNDVEAWKHFLKLYIIYENVLFRFAYGDKISGRESLLKFAYPVAYKLSKILDEINNAKTISNISSAIITDKYDALNLDNVEFDNLTECHYMNTIEFRSPNATTNAVIWQNNINTFAKMLVASKDKVMNEEFLDYKLGKEDYGYYGREHLYNNVDLKNALEFVDLVFDNNLDKIYFLRQYLKNFENNYGLEKAVSAKMFVK